MANLDVLFGGLGLLVLVVGGIAALFGLMDYSTKKGRTRLIGGGVAAILGIFMVWSFGMPTLQLGVPTEAALFNEIKIINASGATIGADDLSLSGIVKVNYTGNTFVSGEYWYFNITVVLGGTDAEAGTVYGIDAGSIPTVTKSTDSTVSGEVVAKQADGDRDVVITVSSTDYDEKVTVTQKQLTTVTIGFQVKWDSVLSKMVSAQYPLSFTVTYIISGTDIGSTTLSLHVTVDGQV